MPTHASVYVLLMWLLFHGVLFCFCVFSHWIVPSLIQGSDLFTFASLIPAWMGEELAEEEESDLSCLLLQACSVSPVPSSAFFPLQPLPLSWGSAHEWSLKGQDCPQGKGSGVSFRVLEF